MKARPTGLSFLNPGAFSDATMSLRSLVGSPPFIAACARVSERVARATACGRPWSISHWVPAGAAAAAGAEFSANAGAAPTIVAAAKRLEYKAFINLLLQVDCATGPSLVSGGRVGWWG